MNKLKVNDRIVAIKSPGGEYQIGDKGVIHYIDISCIPYFVLFDNGNRVWCNERNIALDTAVTPQKAYKLIITSNKSIQHRITLSGDVVLSSVGHMIIAEHNEPVAAPEPPKPEPIMIGSKEIKVGSKFILKPYEAVSHFVFINEGAWEGAFAKVQTVISIDYEAGYVNTGRFNFRAAAIDRIIEVET